MLTEELRDSRIFIRPLKQEDMDILFNWESYPDDEAVYKFPQPSDIERGKEQTFVRWTDPKQFVCGIICDGNKKIVGFIHFFKIKEQEATMGISIRASKMGMGYGLEAGKLWCFCGFQTLGFRKITVEIRLENNRSVWCFHKLGFIPIRFEKRDHFDKKVIYAIMEKRKK